jgi:hypothetical protein
MVHVFYLQDHYAISTTLGVEPNFHFVRSPSSVSISAFFLARIGVNDRGIFRIGSIIIILAANFFFSRVWLCV